MTAVWHQRKQKYYFKTSFSSSVQRTYRMLSAAPKELQKDSWATVRRPRRRNRNALQQSVAGVDQSALGRRALLNWISMIASSATQRLCNYWHRTQLLLTLTLMLQSLQSCWRFSVRNYHTATLTSAIFDVKRTRTDIVRSLCLAYGLISVVQCPVFLAQTIWTGGSHTKWFIHNCRQKCIVGCCSMLVDSHRKTNLDWLPNNDISRIMHRREG